MALVLKDRIQETTTTTGTGTYTLAGAKAGFSSFSDIGDGNTTYYACTDGTDFEVGKGTYTASGTTLARTSLFASSNSNNAVSWGAGVKDIFVTYPSDKAVFKDLSNYVLLDDDGLSTDSADALLHLEGTNGTGNSNPITLRFTDRDTSVANDQIIGRIEFEGKDSNVSGVGSFIQGVAENLLNGKQYLAFGTGVADSATERLRISGDGQVLIGASSASALNTISDDLIVSNTTDGTGSGISIVSSATDGYSSIHFGDTDDADIGRIQYNNSDNAMTFRTNASDAMTINSSGDLLVDRIALPSTNTGAEGLISLDGSGVLIRFNEGGNFRGRIGENGNDIYITSTYTGFRFDYFTNHVIPSTNSGNIQDNADSFGHGNARWVDIFASNGTIQTSDEREKQQITSLTDAEITAATAISKLFKTYKWNSAVEEKGDSARIHTGVIAQEISTAMANEGLDASNYAFWCEDTWWEVENSDGSIEVQSKLEMEAPEGAVQKNRKGIRYPQLLAFIGAATEQRLSSIEARLDALEGN